MREIKFRAWDKTGERYKGTYLTHICVSNDVVVVVQYHANNKGGYSPVSVKQLTNPEVDNLIIEQFTGLKDKNGVDIYEGDIVEILREDNKLGILKHKSGQFKEKVTIGAAEWTELGDQSSGGMDGNYPIIEVEVISNVHEKEG